MATSMKDAIFFSSSVSRYICVVYLKILAIYNVFGTPAVGNVAVYVMLFVVPCHVSSLDIVYMCALSMLYP